MIQLTTIATNTEYGLGIFRYNRRINNRTVYSHGGTFLGFINENAIDTFSGVAISVMTNQDSISNARLLTSFIPALHRHTLGLPYLSTKLPDASLNFTVFPNPTNGSIHVYAPDNASILRYQLISADGKLQQEGLVENGIIEFQSANPGLYILQLTDTNRGTVGYKKVMVQ